MRAVECLCHLGSFLLREDFSKNLAIPLIKWIEDPVFAVREAVLETLKHISVSFKDDWTKIHVMPLVSMLSYSPAFSKRMTALRIISKLGPFFDEKEFYKCLECLSKDRVPNIRFNVAKTVKSLIENTNIRKDALTLLEKLKEDSDMDVKYYAEDALNGIK